MRCTASSKKETVIDMLTSKQRAFLRAKANGLDAIFQVGQGGITENLLNQIGDALEARELIKVAVLNTAPFASTREACDALCERVHAEGVQTIGNRFCIYRQARENSKIKLEEL